MKCVKELCIMSDCVSVRLRGNKAEANTHFSSGSTCGPEMEYLYMKVRNFWKTLKKGQCDRTQTLFFTCTLRLVMGRRSTTLSRPRRTHCLSDRHSRGYVS